MNLQELLSKHRIKFSRDELKSVIKELEALYETL